MTGSTAECENLVKSREHSATGASWNFVDRSCWAEIPPITGKSNNPNYKHCTFSGVYDSAKPDCATNLVAKPLPTFTDI